MDIKKWFFDGFKAAAPEGEIELPSNTEPVKVVSGIHHLVRSYFDHTSNAISRLEGLHGLLSAPKIEYIKGVHTRGTMIPTKGLGTISIIFNSETGEPLFAEILKDEDND